MKISYGVVDQEMIVEDIGDVSPEHALAEAKEMAIGAFRQSGEEPRLDGYVGDYEGWVSEVEGKIAYGISD